jgi:ribosomal protein S11
MGSATSRSSGASSIGYSEAKKGMNQALESDKTKIAVDIAVTGALAVQPNGPAKVATYSHLKYANTFIQTASEKGVEAGIRETGKSGVKAEIANQAAGGVVDSSQQAVSMAAENETVGRGVEEVNKNFSGPSEQAAKDTLGAVFSNGADAMMNEGEGDE